MKTLLLSALLMLGTCGQGPSARWDRAELPRSEKGDILWIADGQKGWEVAAITLLPNNRVEIFAAPPLIYQRARECGLAFDPSVRVCREYIHLIRGLSPTETMTTTGWRRPDVVHYFPLQVFPGAQGRALRLPNSETGISNEIRVFQRGNEYLIVIQTTSLIFDLEELPTVAGGEKR